MNPQALVLLLSALGANYEPEFMALFTTLEYRYTGGDYENEPFRYRLFIPEPTQSPAKQPLIVWLNGFGEAGDDNIQQLRWLSQLMFRPPWQRERYPFFLLAIQSPSDNPAWTGSGGKDEMIRVVEAIMRQTMADYPVDEDRIYLAGISSGGSACWEFGIRRPTLFAAIAPMASGGSNNPELAALKGIPIWAFHSNRDSAPPPDAVRKTVRQLAAKGGSVHLTEVDSAVHDCWNAAFSEHRVLDWLLAQRRGRSGWWTSSPVFAARTRASNFIASWQWWQILLQLGIPVLLVLAVWNARRQRRLRRERLRQAGQGNTASGGFRS